MSDATRAANYDNDALGAAFVVTKDVRLDQLAYEVTEAMNWRKEPVLSTSTPTDDETGEPIDVGGTLVYIDRTDVDDNVFITTVNNHTPNQAWRHPDLPTTTPPPPPEISLEDLYTKVANGDGLTADEQASAVSALLTEWHSRTTT